MKIIQRFTPLTALLLLSACQLIPTETAQQTKQPTDTAATTSAAGPEPVPEESLDLTADPASESIARSIALNNAKETFQSTTTAKNLWQQPLDLTRPDPYDKYPDDLYQVLRRNFTFDLSIEDKRVMQQLRWYASHQSYINRVSDRASRYLFHIVAELQARDMPLDLALLPIVESAFDPFAYSHGSASGMWQFIPSTGRMFDLKQNWWYDGRRDVIESTRGALDYLDQLNRMFDGDWLLALASYNSGPGTVLKAQRRNRAAGKPTDFWHLDLPKETEAYVPKMFALAKLFHSPDKYGIELPYVSTEPFFDIVQTGGQIDLAQAAKLADMSLSDLYLLNPGFNRWATDPDGPHHLLVHAGKGDLFNQRIADLPINKRLTWTRYAIEPGDSLLSIAKKFEVTVDVVKDVNEIRGNLIRAGDTLLIPVASQGDNYYALSAENRLKTKQNALAGSDKNRIDYKVRSGDTFWELSQKFGVSIQSLARRNNMAPKDVLRPGQTLVIWTDQDVPTTSAALDNRSVVRKVGYVVRKGDSLYRIANKFNLNISDIEKWNTLPEKYLQPGDRLTLYVDVTRMQ